MDFILDVVVHRIGVYVLGLLSGGRFKGESGFTWGCAVDVGGLMLLSPFAASLLGSSIPVARKLMSAMVDFCLSPRALSDP